MKRLLLLATLATAGFSQTITVTNPGAGTPTLSGFTGNAFTVSLSGFSATPARVCYNVDAYPAYNPGFGPLLAVGCATAAPFSYNWNTNYVFPGTHTVVATAYDALGVTPLATSASVPFIVGNNYPLSCSGSAPTWTVTTGTALTSPWSGNSTITYQPTDSCATDSNTYQVFVDGVLQQSFISVLATAKTSTIDTTQFPNGPHIVAVTRYDTTKTIFYPTGCSTSCNGAATGGNEWSQTVTFANGAVPSYVQGDAHEVFIQPTNTFSFACTGVNTDLTTTSPTCEYYSQKTSIATVNASTGLVTGIATGSAKIRLLEEQFQFSDLAAFASLSRVSSASYSFGTSSIGRVLHITSGTNWIPGFYEITAVNAGVATLSSNSSTSTGATGGVYETGPSRTEWVFVGAPAYIPHFSGSGQQLSNYVPGGGANGSVSMSEMFGSISALNDQVYFPGIGPDICASGFNTFETGALYQDAATIAASFSAYQSAEASYISSSQGLANNPANVASYCPKAFWYVTGDGFVRNTNSMYATTKGTLAQYAPTNLSGLAEAVRQWTATGNTISFDMMDEGIPAYQGPPLQGPITFNNSPTTQSWLVSISSNGTTCTANAPGWGIDGSTGSGAPFNITGATTSGLNATPGTTQFASSAGANSFTFPCTAAAGTYNKATDPSLQLNPLNMNFWAPITNDTIPYTGLAYLRQQADTITGRPGFTMSAQAGAAVNCPALQSFYNNTLGQSLLGVTQFGDNADMYISDVSDYYLMARLQSQGITDAGQNFQSIGSMRNVFGCYSPTIPLISQIGTTSDVYGLGGYTPTVTITSFVNDLITFSGPHGVTNVIPGDSRLTVAGSSTTAQNTNYYIVAWPTPTTLQVVYQSPTTISNPSCPTSSPGGGTGGTINWQDGSTTTLAGGVDIITCSGGAIGNHMSWFVYQGAPSALINKHRGQTFTLTGVTGTDAAYFNSTTFRYSPENVLNAQDTNGAATNAANYFREVPALSGTGGTVAITPDNTLIKGRGNSVSVFGGAPRHPAMSFAMLIEATIIRAAGTRAYKLGYSVDGYQATKVGLSSKQGWMGLISGSLVSIFNDTDTANQLFMHPHFENASSVPMFHAASMAGLEITRDLPLLYQTPLNSPDYGSTIDCAARGGSNGAILLCGNFSDGPQTRIVTFTPYLQSGQQFVCQVWQWQGAVAQTIFSAGTSSASFTLQPDDSLKCSFPATFSGYLSQPTISPRLADVTNATKIAIRWSYDQYWIDAPINNVVDCGTGANCKVPVDQNVGTVYYRIIYLNSSGAILATSDVQTL